MIKRSSRTLLAAVFCFGLLAGSASAAPATQQANGVWSWLAWVWAAVGGADAGETQADDPEIHGVFTPGG